MLPVLIAVAAGGLWLAALAHRRSSPLLGVLICAATCLAVSPISWVHHMVWVVPAILWLALAPDRPRWGRALAAGTAVLFWSAPVWWVPYKNTSDLHLGVVQLIAGNSFFFAMAIFVLGAAVLVLRRRAIASSGRASTAAAGLIGLRHGQRRARPTPAAREAARQLSKGCALWDRTALPGIERHRQNDRPGRGDRGGSGGIRHPALLIRVRAGATISVRAGATSVRRLTNRSSVASGRHDLLHARRASFHRAGHARPGQFHVRADPSRRETDPAREREAGAGRRG